MQRQVTVGSVSWINSAPNPIWGAAQAVLLNPGWVPKTYIGLVATSNNAPPKSIPDFAIFRKTMDFRALMYCTFSVSINDRTQQVSNFSVIEAVHDPGWTPPFRIRKFPSTVFRIWDPNIRSSQWHAGEASPLSLVNTQARHGNTTITGVPANETVLVNGLIKFRAGAHTDTTGTGSSVGCPYHVPWVWCELLLTIVNGQLKLYGRGSTFPTHHWFLDGQCLFTSNQVSDSRFPKKTAGFIGPPVSLPTPAPRASVPHPLTIDVERLALYPVLSAGAPASGPQVPLHADMKKTGAVYTHPYTAPPTPIKRM